jgi:hypothetical protein
MIDVALHSRHRSFLDVMRVYKQICRRSHVISHLLFADGSLLFFKANMEQASKINVVLPVRHV